MGALGRDTAEAERSAVFSALFNATYDRIRGYASRRIDPGRVDDVVSETFLAAWRRFDDLPTDRDAAVGWLYRTAELVIMNLVRSQRRRSLLGQRLVSETGVPQPGVSPGDESTELADAFTSLTREDQSILLLAAWDGLTNPEIGAVLGCSAGTAATRLSRARSRFSSAAIDRGVEVT